MSSFATHSAKGSSAVKSIYTLFVFLERLRLATEVWCHFISWSGLCYKIKKIVCQAWFLGFGIFGLSLCGYGWACIHAPLLFPVAVRACMEHIVNWILWTVINHNHSVHQVFFVICHVTLCFSRFPSNILQSQRPLNPSTLTDGCFMAPADTYARTHKLAVGCTY